MRISRDAEAARAREEERLERERRAALPEEVRLQEDMERAEKSRADKPQGKQKFLQKYWHKGAFHQVCLSGYLSNKLSDLAWPIRMLKFSNDTTLLRPPSPLLTPRFYPL